MTEEQFAETAVALRRLQREFDTHYAERERLKQQGAEVAKQFRAQDDVLRKLAAEMRPLIHGLLPEGTDQWT